MVKTQSSQEKLIFKAACVYYLADMLLPVSQYYSSVYINIFAVLVIVYTILKNIEFNKITLFVKPIILIMVLITINTIIREGSSKGTIIAFYSTILIFLPSILSFYLITTNEIKTIKFLIAIILAFVFITSITSIYGLIEYPLAARDMATGMKDDPVLQIYYKMNIAGFSIIYMIPILIPMIYVLFSQKPLKYYQLIILTIPMLYFVYKSQYTIAIIITVFIIVGSIFARKYTFSKFLFGSIFAVILFFILQPMIAGLFHQISATQSYDVGIRLNALGDKIMDGSTTSETIELRQNAYINSIETFFSSPILGNTLTNTGTIGGHSFILDMIAGYGIIGIIAIYLMYRQIYRYLYKVHRSYKYFGYMMVSFIFSTILSIFNTSPNLFAICLFVPLVAFVILFNNKNHLI